MTSLYHCVIYSKEATDKRRLNIPLVCWHCMHIRVYNYIYVILGTKGVGNTDSMYKNCDHSYHLQKYERSNLIWILSYKYLKDSNKSRTVYGSPRNKKKIINCVRCICSTLEQDQVLKQLNNCRIAFV